MYSSYSSLFVSKLRGSVATVRCHGAGHKRGSPSDSRVRAPCAQPGVTLPPCGKRERARSSSNTSRTQVLERLRSTADAVLAMRCVQLAARAQLGTWPDTKTVSAREIVVRIGAHIFKLHGLTLIQAESQPLVASSASGLSLLKRGRRHVTPVGRLCMA